MNDDADGLPTAEEFAAIAQEAGGDRLLAVVTYTESDVDVHYLSEILSEGYSQEELAAAVNAFKKDEVFEAERKESHKAGDHYGSFHLYDDAVVALFPQPSEYSALVAHKPVIDEQFGAFLQTCLEALDWSSPENQ